MTGSILQLVAYGIEDIFLTNDSIILIRSIVLRVDISCVVDDLIKLCMTL